MSLEILRKGDGWVQFVYSDDSIKFFRTTLDIQLLNSLNISIPEGLLYDMDRNEFVAIPDNVVITITKERPRVDELNEYINRFI